LMGDFTLTCLAPDRFWLIGSYYLQEWHQRWFQQHKPGRGVRIENLSESWLGFSLSGPYSREILRGLTREDVSEQALPFFACRPMDIGFTQAIVARLSLTGELGFEITVPAMQQRALWQVLLEQGTPVGLRPIGTRAQDSLRLEKGYGVWSLEYTSSYTPAMSGLDRYIDYDKGEFVGRAAALRERETPPAQRLVLLSIDARDADAAGYEPIWSGEHRVGFVTSGTYGHHVKQSLALAYVQSSALEARDSLEVEVIGERRAARVLPEAPYDPRGWRPRG
jgi:dimethylglycine dehydrogenase